MRNGAHVNRYGVGPPVLPAIVNFALLAQWRHALHIGDWRWLYFKKSQSLTPILFPSLRVICPVDED